MRLFDTHAHLDDEQFDAIRDDVLDRARRAGVTRIIAVGTTLASSRACVELSQRYTDVDAAVGIQPNYCGEAAGGDWDAIVQLSEHPRVVAIGETGLDRHWDYTPLAMQKDYFDRHLRLSRASGLPFIVHMRDCGDDIVEMLSEARLRGPLTGVMHSFTGDAELARRCLALGMHISFAGMVTFKKSVDLRMVAATIPDDRILVETDAPYLSPHPHRGQRPNEPELIQHTARCVAEARGEDVDKFAERTTQNALSLFVRRG